MLIVLTYREAELNESHPLYRVLHELNRERLATRLKLPRFDRDQTQVLLSVLFQERPAQTSSTEFLMKPMATLFSSRRYVRRWLNPANYTGKRVPGGGRAWIRSRYRKAFGERLTCALPGCHSQRKIHCAQQPFWGANLRLMCCAP